MINLSNEAKKPEGICINHKLVNILTKNGVSIKKRREYIEAVNSFCLFRIFEYPELLYSRVESFVNNGLKGEKLEKEIEEYFNDLNREIAEARFRSNYPSKGIFP